MKTLALLAGELDSSKFFAALPKIKEAALDRLFEIDPHTKKPVIQTFLNQRADNHDIIELCEFLKIKPAELFNHQQQHLRHHLLLSKVPNKLRLAQLGLNKDERRQLFQTAAQRGNYPLHRLGQTNPQAISRYLNNFEGENLTQFLLLPRPLAGTRNRILNHQTLLSTYVQAPATDHDNSTIADLVQKLTLPQLLQVGLALNKDPAIKRSSALQKACKELKNKIYEQINSLFDDEEDKKDFLQQRCETLFLRPAPFYSIASWFARTERKKITQMLTLLADTSTSLELKEQQLQAITMTQTSGWRHLLQIHKKEQQLFRKSVGRDSHQASGKIKSKLYAISTSIEEAVQKGWHSFKQWLALLSNARKTGWLRLKNGSSRARSTSINRKWRNLLSGLTSIYTITSVQWQSLASKITSAKSPAKHKSKSSKAKSSTIMPCLQPHQRKDSKQPTTTWLQKTLLCFHFKHRKVPSTTTRNPQPNLNKEEKRRPTPKR